MCFKMFSSVRADVRGSPRDSGGHSLPAGRAEMNGPFPRIWEVLKGEGMALQNLSSVTGTVTNSAEFLAPLPSEIVKLPYDFGKSYQRWKR
jgi:hypothetical protein